jgi:amino acid adenylation domain-containing protein
VIGLLGILKAGGAYVPIDPGYPEDRKAYMLEDSAVTLVLSQSWLGAALPLQDQTVLYLDRMDEELKDQPTHNLPVASLGLRPEHLAYVIYTSGSTGRPKGVMVEHRNLNRLFKHTERYFSFGTMDVWTVFHSFAFDFSVWELWGALLYGGKAVVVSSLVARSPRDFLSLLAEEKVTVLNQTPSAFEQLSLAAATVPNLEHAIRLVIFGGESLNPATLGTWQQLNRSRQMELVNMYGITEITVHTTYKQMTEELIFESPMSNIGVPLQDMHILLLGPSNKKLQPPGVIGEIYVGGPGVARGYLNKVELTAEKFIRNPFDETGESRLYRTGDLARWLPDGNLEYMGRIDDQVKIRGFRIELGEIESRLLELDAVNACVVLARDDGTGQKQLVAYVVPAGGELDIEDVLKRLQEQLPEYMVPGAYVALTALPLTSNGKVDRKALPAPDSSAYAQGSYVAPETGVEICLADIWQRILKLDRVGSHDNFFAVGGDSMRAIAVMNEAARKGLKFRIGDLLAAPRIHQLAKLIESSMAYEEERPDLDDLLSMDEMEFINAKYGNKTT